LIEILIARVLSFVLNISSNLSLIEDDKFFSCCSMFGPAIECHHVRLVRDFWRYTISKNRCL